MGNFIEGEPKFIIIPTLEELIKACGTEFYSLENRYSSLRPEKERKERWVAFSHSAKFGANGETPEEAVSKLWLKLNKKDENNPSSDK